MKTFPNNQHPEIDYPTAWQYKLVGRDEAAVREAVQQIVETRECRLEPSNRSRTGKYVSLNLQLKVESEEDRLSLYHRLGECEAIIYVL